MNIIGRLLLMCCLLAGWALPARADLDQLCLKQCIGNGNAARGCMADCSYNLPADAAASGAAKNAPPALTKLAPSHNVFAAPVPIGSDRIIVRNKASSALPDKDYVCFNQCLHNGNAYLLCDKICAKTACPAGAANCANATVTRVLNGNALTAPH